MGVTCAWLYGWIRQYLEYVDAGVQDAVHRAREEDREKKDKSP